MARYVLKNLDLHEFAKQKGDFVFKLGHAIAVWAKVERLLYYAFKRITGIDDKMGRAIFYGAKGFGLRADMLEGVIPHATTINADEIEFIKTALKKARQFSAFRNKLAHGEPTQHLHRPGLNQADTALIDNEEPDKEPDIWTEDIEIATENFNLLADAMADFFIRRSHPGIVERCLAQVLRLPNEANLEAAPIPSKPETPIARPHRNKKAYRVAKKKRL